MWKYLDAIRSNRETTIENLLEEYPKLVGFTSANFRISVDELDNYFSAREGESHINLYENMLEDAEFVGMAIWEE